MHTLSDLIWITLHLMICSIKLLAGDEQVAVDRVRCSVVIYGPLVQQLYQKQWSCTGLILLFIGF